MVVQFQNSDFFFFKKKIKIRVYTTQQPFQRTWKEKLDEK